MGVDAYGNHFEWQDWSVLNTWVCLSQSKSSFCLKANVFVLLHGINGATLSLPVKESKPFFPSSITFQVKNYISTTMGEGSSLRVTWLLCHFPPLSRSLNKGVRLWQFHLKLGIWGGWANFNFGHLYTIYKWGSNMSNCICWKKNVRTRLVIVVLVPF